MRISDWSSDVCSSDLPRFSALPAHRPAILCEDAAGTAQSRGVDREAVRRQGRAIFRTSAAQPLRDRARARRVGALLYRRPRRTRHLSGEHLEPALAAALFAARADAARKRAGARLPAAACGGESRYARLPGRHLSLGPWRGMGALFRYAWGGNGK